MASADWMCRRAALLLLPAACAVAACEGRQSALAPAGEDAARLADLFWWMTAGATVIWTAFMALALHAVFSSRGRLSATGGRRLVIAGGLAFPVLLLTALLSYGLAMMPSLLEPAPEGALRIQVTGEQWWWRVRYLPAGGDPVESANEIRLAVGEPVELLLETRDVIHSIWIPSLGGKMDMIPGRRTRLTLLPTRTGNFRGTCAEYCGTSHAWMAFEAVVLEKEAFAQWLDEQREPAAPAPGEELLEFHGCGACHTVRGTGADGLVGPDLTHVGGRLSLGAGRLDNDVESFERWIRETHALKPGVVMPEFGMLPADDVRALAEYLEGLQ